MKLYDFAFSPNCRKVRAVAYELEVPLESVPVDLLRGETRTPEFLAVNPNGRVPVLVDGDFVLFESTAIIRYLSAKRGGRLVPETVHGPRAVSASADRRERPACAGVLSTCNSRRGSHTQCDSTGRDA
jgi:glutathione S-transferase